MQNCLCPRALRPAGKHVGVDRLGVPGSGAVIEAAGSEHARPERCLVDWHRRWICKS